LARKIIAIQSILYPSIPMCINDYYSKVVNFVNNKLKNIRGKIF